MYNHDKECWGGGKKNEKVHSNSQHSYTNGTIHTVPTYSFIHDG